MAVGLKACQTQSAKPPEVPPTPYPAATQSGSPVSLYGAGATFPVYLYQKWFSEYNRINSNIQVSYQPVGSAAGIQQFIAATTDFSGSDTTPTDADLAKVKNGAVLIPTTAGSIAVVYNLPGVSGLKLSRKLLADIFLGKITSWNDPELKALNPALALPNQPITTVHRSDGSGTTAAFTAHLSAISPEWKERVGTGLSVQWLAGTGIKDNAGISAQIQQATGTIGYVEYAFAKQLGLAIATIQNKANQYVSLTDESVRAALSTVQFSEDLRGSVPDPGGETSYPLVTYSWVLAYQKYADSAKAKALRDILQWGLTDGQKFASELGYVPLPEEVAKKAIAVLSQIQ
ncbi:phosphate ABC transporter substrate-binding protein PstS [Leptolyngbya sp. Cla-17]|uniref:phosphate ABC transporter substrate-binding protein PstS n=1 Tax=Leptolyngbya sp. Cla-17 TaxID=2803751 RepID=UPI001F5C320B|nr:phosphate ABC transporter substrate-binding protein PstS [Leptolyngbya sp. Cla-17]